MLFYDEFLNFATSIDWFEIIFDTQKAVPGFRLGMLINMSNKMCFFLLYVMTDQTADGWITTINNLPIEHSARIFYKLFQFCYSRIFHNKQ